MKRVLLVFVVLLLSSTFLSSQQKSNLLQPKAAAGSDLFPAKLNAYPSPEELAALPGFENSVAARHAGRLKGTSYLPLKVTVDDTMKTTYTYGANGYMETGLIQRLSGTTWVNYMREKQSFGSNNELLVSSSELWVNNAWVMVSRQTMTYDNKGFPSVTVSEGSDNGGPLTNQMRYTYTFANGSMTSYLMEIWQNNAWMNMSRNTYTFTAAGMPLTALMELWMGTSWVGNYKLTFEYNSNNRMTSQLSQQMENGVWKDKSKTTRTYDSNGFVLTETMQADANGTLRNVSRVSYTYENMHNKTTTEEFWNSVSNAWNFYKRYTYTYQNDDMIASLTEEYTNGNWVPEYKVESQYNNDGNLTANITFAWTGQAWENRVRNTIGYEGVNVVWEQTEIGDGAGWANWSRNTYKFVDGNATEGRAFKWMNNSWQPARTSLYMYFNNSSDNLSFMDVSVVLVEYTISTGVENETAVPGGFSLAQNYPNPFNPSTVIKYSLGKETNVKLTVYDALGNKVKELVNDHKPAGEHTVTFNAGRLASGTYFYRLETNGFSTARKLMLVK